MSLHNISAIVLAITLLYVIVSFTIYFNNPGLNKAWSIQQKDKGLVELDVHSPELMLEKNYTNATTGAQRIGITYPAMAATMIENHTITTIKINNTRFQ
jgi:hypothetical protein